MSSPSPEPSPRHAFATTRWSLVAAAGRPDDPRAGEALAYLCESYWFPVYAYVRRAGHGRDEAEDLTQSFFARVLERRDLAGADAGRGQFRAYLLGAVRHFLSGERRHAGAQRRGGGRVLMSLDAEDGERRLVQEPAGGRERAPEAAFERAFALTLLERVLARLAGEQEALGRAAEFALLRTTLTGSADGGPARPLAELARELGTSEGAVKTRTHRLRQRYGELLRGEIAETLAPGEGREDAVEEEIRALFRALSESA